MNERTKPVECNLAISSVVGIGDTKTIPAASTHTFFSFLALSSMSPSPFSLLTCCGRWQYGNQVDFRNSNEDAPSILTGALMVEGGSVSSLGDCRNDRHLVLQYVRFIHL